jgi:hypothetical protein
MRRLSSEEVGPFRMAMIDLLATSPDPYAGIIYTIDVEPLNELIKAESAKANIKITMAPLINKLIALAIAENPTSNQIILGRRVYQMEEIHIANIVPIPGTDALTFLMLENPHLKSLQALQQQLLVMMVEKTKAYAAPQNSVMTSLIRFFLKTGLYRLISKKFIFTMGFEREVLSNISLSIHIYPNPTTFMMAKDIINTIDFTLRFHACGTIRQPFVENGMLRNREMLPLYLSGDHRLFHGIHANNCGVSLERIASDPEKYLL